MPLNVKIPKNVFAAAKAKMAESGSGEYDDDIKLNPGRHVAITERLDILEIQGETKFIFRLKVAGESEQAGGRVSIWYTFNEEFGHHALKALQKLGYDDVDPSDLETIQKDIAKAKHVVRITAKDNGEYVNIFLDKKLEDLSASDVGGESSADETNDAGPKGMGKAAPAAVTKPKPAKAPPAPAPEKEPEVLDDLEAMDRDELKAVVEAEEVEIAIKKTTTEEQLREAIRAHRAANDTETPAAGSSAEPEVNIEVGMAVKITVKGKKLDGKIVGVDETSGVVKVKDKAGAIHKVTDLETIELT